MENVGSGKASAHRTVWWWLALGAILIGAALRLWQWSLGTTYFMDELAVVHNLVTRPLGQLLGAPLAEAQVAPPLFLLVEKYCLVVLGPSELSLRLPALLASFAALLLLWSVARRVLDERLVPLALLTFAVGFTFVYYSNQVKQYAGDAAITLLAIRLALGLREAAPTMRFRVGAALAGLVLPFYSQASVLVFAGCGATLVLLAFLDSGRTQLRATVAVVGAWAVGSGASLAQAQALLQPTTRVFMQYFWHEGLLPLNAHLPVVLAGELTERWANGLGWPHPASLWLAASLVGTAVLWRRRRETALLLLAPWAVGVVASALQQFPLRARLMDFLMPIMVLLVFVGAQAIVSWAWGRSRPLGLAALGLCTVPILYSTTRHNLPPFCMEDAKPLLAQLAEARRPGDAVYAYYGTGQYLRWYGPRYGLTDYHLGRCYRHLPGAERNYLKEVDSFRGRRVWVVMGHFDGADEHGLTTYLDSIGRRGSHVAVRWKMPDEAIGYPIMYAQLYDLSDAKRAAHFSAATFPLPPTLTSSAADICWSCYGPQVIAN